MQNLINKGFTLVELLVTIAIIGVLATMAIAGVNIAREKAKIAVAQNDVNEISKAISFLANDSLEWPGHQAINTVASGAGNEICGLDSDGGDCGAGNTISDPSSGIVANDSYSGWSGPYMLEIPLDPWGYEYFFDTDYQINSNNEPWDCGGVGPITAVVIGSYGPDGLGNNDYNCDDIIKIIYQ